MNREHQRLSAVNRFKYLNAGVNQDLDNIAGLIAQICEVPVALVTIIDGTTQWFKAQRGIDIDCNERELSFCNTTIELNELLIVPDTLHDERFNQLPVVANEPHVRFYAGAPLTTYDGYAVGTLCVLDVKPREFTPTQQNALRTLAKQVLNILELNWSLQSLAEQHDECERQRHEIEAYSMKLKAVFNSAKDIHILLSKTFDVLAFNKAAEKHFLSYYNTPIKLGESILSYIHPEGAKRLMVYFNNALAGVSHQIEWQFELHQEKYWLNICFTGVYNDAHQILGVSVNASDVTLTKRQEARVEQQQAALQRIATLQSNELRKPVASLMGIIDLMKDEPHQADKHYMTMMSAAVDEMDQKLQLIVKEAEATIYSKKETA